MGQLPISSIKGVKKKTPLLWPDFFLASSPPRLSRIVLAFRSGSRDAGSFSQRFWFSLRAVFIAFAQRSRSVRRPTSSSGCQVATMVLLGTRGPAFSGCPRRTRVAWETERARGTQSLTNQLSLALEPECLRNPTDDHRKKFQD